LDPLGVCIVPSANEDLGGDSAIVVFITNGAKGEFKGSVSLTVESLDAVL